MAFRLQVDAGSVDGAATSVRAVGEQLDAAPAGSALSVIAAALPGGELAASASEEAAEWAAEVAELGAVFERYAAALTAAVESQRRLDQDAAGRLAGP